MDFLEDDEFIRKYQSGEIPRFKGHLTEENWEKEIENTPLFMTQSPEFINGELAPAVSALQSLMEEDQDPISRANYHKDHGNEEYKLGLKFRKSANLRTAAKSYTMALAEMCADDTLDATIYANRAAVHLRLENFRSALDDCYAASAKEIPMRDVTFAVKVFFRAAKACLGLERFDESINWCEKGLSVDATNSDLQVLRKKVQDKQSAALKLLRRKEKQMRAKRKADGDLANSLRALDITMVNTDGTQPFSMSKPAVGEYDEVNMKETQLGTTVSLDDQGILSFPVTLLYPQYMQTDSIAAFSIEHTFEDHFMVMFDPSQPPAPWDISHEYRLGNVAVFVRPTDNMVQCDDTVREAITHRLNTGESVAALIQVPIDMTLGEALKLPGVEVQDSLVSFMVIPINSKIAVEYRS